LIVARFRKTVKFARFNLAANCFGGRQRHEGTWQAYLGRRGPLVLELGCGSSWLGLELARRHPDHRILAIDRKADRMQQAAYRAQTERLNNIAYLQCAIADLMDHIAARSVSAIWLPFPDPYPKRAQSKHRLSGGDYLKIYARLLKIGGQLYLKTDSADLAAWTRRQFSAQRSFGLLSYSTDTENIDDQSDISILTAYEKRYRAAGKTIHYLNYRRISSRS